MLAEKHSRVHVENDSDYEHHRTLVTQRGAKRPTGGHVKRKDTGTKDKAGALTTAHQQALKIDASLHLAKYNKDKSARRSVYHKEPPHRAQTEIEDVEGLLSLIESAAL